MGVLRAFTIGKDERLPPARRSELKKGSEVWVHDVFGEFYKVKPAIVTKVSKSAAEVNILAGGPSGKDRPFINFSRLSHREGSEYLPADPEPPKRRVVTHPPTPKPAPPKMPPVTLAAAPNNTSLTHQPLANVKEIAVSDDKSTFQIPKGIELVEPAVVIGRSRSSKSDRNKKIDRYIHVVISDLDGNVQLRTVGRRRHGLWEACEARRHTKYESIDVALILRDLDSDGDMLDPECRAIAEHGWLELKSELEEEHRTRRREETRELVKKKVESLADDQLDRLAELLK